MRYIIVLVKYQFHTFSDNYLANALTNLCIIALLISIVIQEDFLKDASMAKFMVYHQSCLIANFLGNVLYPIQTLTPLKAVEMAEDNFIGE